jgi:hypothetical protein
VKPVGHGVSELRLTIGPGYRIYYLQDGDTVILLLVGGDRSSQQKDIEKAQELAEEWRKEQASRRTAMSTTEKYKRFDPAGYLDDLEDVAGYLAIALEQSDDDPLGPSRPHEPRGRKQIWSLRQSV